MGTLSTILFAIVLFIGIYFAFKLIICYTAAFILLITYCKISTKEEHQTLKKMFEKQRAHKKEIADFVTDIFTKRFSN